MSATPHPQHLAGLGVDAETDFAVVISLAVSTFGGGAALSRRYRGCP